MIFTSFGAKLTFALLFLDANATQAIGGIYLLVELIAIVLFAVRLVPAAIRGSIGRHLAASTVFVFVAIAIFRTPLLPTMLVLAPISVWLHRDRRAVQ